MTRNERKKTIRDDAATATDADALRAEFEKFIVKCGLRRTPERFAILDRICRLEAHFEVDELYEMMEHEGYHVSRGTVYNTINLLCKCGILRRLLFDTLQPRYELASTSHLHIICTQCGDIREVDNQEALSLIESMKVPRFSPSHFSATIYGICSKCKRKLSRKANKS